MSEDALTRLVAAAVKAQDQQEQHALQKQLRSHAKRSDANVEQVYHAVWAQLLVNSSEVRLVMAKGAASHHAVAPLRFSTQATGQYKHTAASAR